MSEAFMTALDHVFTSLAADNKDLMIWYDEAKRAPVIGDDPPKYSTPSTFHNL